MTVNIKMDPRLRGDDDTPSMNVDDLGAGAHTPHDGWCDPNGLLWGFRRKAVELGAVYVKDRVVAAGVDGGSARAVVLASGERVAADAFVNAAGAWSGEVAAMFGMKLPVTPMRRFEHYFTAGSPIERLPYVKDVERLAFRSEGKGFSGGAWLTWSPRDAPPAATDLHGDFHPGTQPVNDPHQTVDRESAKICVPHAREISRSCTCHAMRLPDT